MNKSDLTQLVDLFTDFGINFQRQGTNISIDEGEGNGFSCVFVFDADGKFVEHAVYK